VTADSPYYPGRSPDGKYIAYTIEFYDELRFEHNLGDYLSNVFVENVGGSYKRNITAKFQPGAFGGIDWSPDGKHFAFTGITPSTAGTYSTNLYLPNHIYLANADGSNLRMLNEGISFHNDQYDHGYQNEAWSPDGRRLAFLTSNGIAIVNGDGSAFSEYKVQNNSSARDIFWLDDNQHLVFTDSDDTFYKINADFTSLENLPLATDLEKMVFRMQLLKTHQLSDRRNHYIYDLSPDRKWLVYIETGIDPNRCNQLRVLSVETGQSYLVIDKEGLIPYLLKHSPNQDLRILSVDSIADTSRFDTILWSPNSGQLLFTHSYLGLNAFRYQDFFAINLDGTGLRLIMDDAWNPAIQP
jgi:hypothetical protein